jgi:hypothetical protein
MANWFQVQLAEYRYQRALAAKAKEAEALIRRLEAALAEIDRNGRVPETHKAVARLAARDKLYAGEALAPYQKVNADLRVEMGGVADARELDAPPNPRGKGIGAFFGRLFNGRATEAQRRRQAETIGRFDHGDGFTLNYEEQAALKDYRDAVSREHPRGGEALEVAAAIGDHGRPRRYRSVESAMREIEVSKDPECNTPERKADTRAMLHTKGSNMLGMGDGTGGTVKPSKLIEGDSPSARDATYRLGWASYAVFRRTPEGLFKGVSGAKVDPQETLDANGKVVVGAITPNEDMLEGKEFGQITTAGVTACSVIIVKKGDQYAMLHLDAKHTEPGEAQDFLLTQMQAAFGDGPGDIEIMESIRTPDESERDFCDALEAQLGNGGRNNVKVQRLDRSAGKPDPTGFVDEPPGHLEIGITPQDVVFGDRADVSNTDPQTLHVVPVEWRLGAPQETVDAIWKQDHQYYQEFSTVEAENKRANDMAAERRAPTNQARDGFSVQGEAPGMAQAEAARQLAMETAARQQTRSESQATAPQREQAQTQATAPQRERISRDTLDAAVRPHTPAVPTGRRRADSMRVSAPTPPEHAEPQRRSAGK